MTKTLDELRELAAEFFCEIVEKGDDVDDPGYWIIDGEHLICPVLPSLEMVEEMLDTLAEDEEANGPRTPPAMTDADRAEIARKIADRPTITTGEKTPRRFALAGQLDLFFKR